MLVTTSRYPPVTLRELGRSISIVFSGEYISRGKKKFDDLIEYARRKGHSRVCILSSQGIDFSVVDELGNWEWIEDRVVLKSVRFSKEMRSCSGLEGKDSGLVSRLFGFETNEKSENNVICNEGVILFPADGSIMKLEVSYERQMQHND